MWTPMMRNSGTSATAANQIRSAAIEIQMILLIGTGLVIEQLDVGCRVGAVLEQAGQAFTQAIESAIKAHDEEASTISESN